MARLVYGVHPAVEALRAGRVQALFVLEGEAGPALRAVFDAARDANVTAISRPRQALEELCRGAAHQGVVAIAGEYPYSSVKEVLREAEVSGKPPLVLALDGVQDPQNFGAIVRTAHVVGVHGILLPKDRSVSVTPTVVKASAGATEHMRIAVVTNMARALEELKQGGLWIAGAVAVDGELPWAVDFAVPLALVLGAEGKGIRPLVLRGCDLLVRIPMAGQVASLNVGAAGAMLLYEVARQRAGVK